MTVTSECRGSGLPLHAGGRESTRLTLAGMRPWERCRKHPGEVASRSEAPVWAGGLDCAVSVLRGLQTGRYQARLGAVNLRGCTFLALSWSRVPPDVLRPTPLIFCVVKQLGKIRTPFSCSGPLVPSTEKAQYYVDCKGEFHPLLQSRY